MTAPAKKCIINKPNGAVRVTRRELADYIREIIDDNSMFGAMHGYTDKEIDDYRRDAFALRKSILTYFDSEVEPVFDWDWETELPVIPSSGTSEGEEASK